MTLKGAMRDPSPKVVHNENFLLKEDLSLKMLLLKMIGINYIMNICQKNMESETKNIYTRTKHIG